MSSTPACLLQWSHTFKQPTTGSGRRFWITYLLNVLHEQLLPVAVVHRQPQDHLVLREKVAKLNFSMIHMFSRVTAVSYSFCGDIVFLFSADRLNPP